MSPFAAEMPGIKPTIVSHQFKVPDERLGAVLLNLAKRSSYMTEVVETEVAFGILVVACEHLAVIKSRAKLVSISDTSRKNVRRPM